MKENVRKVCSRIPKEETEFIAEQIRNNGDRFAYRKIVSYKNDAKLYLKYFNNARKCA